MQEERQEEVGEALLELEMEMQDREKKRAACFDMSCREFSCLIRRNTKLETREENRLMKPKGKRKTKKKIGMRGKKMRWIENCLG